MEKLRTSDPRSSGSQPETLAAREVFHKLQKTWHCFEWNSLWKLKWFRPICSEKLKRGGSRNRRPRFKSQVGHLLADTLRHLLNLSSYYCLFHYSPQEIQRLWLALWHSWYSCCLHSISYWQFGSHLLLHFWLSFSFREVHPSACVHVCWPLWKTQMEFLLPVTGLAQHQSLRSGNTPVIWEANQWKKVISFFTFCKI